MSAVCVCVLFGRTIVPILPVAHCPSCVALHGIYVGENTTADNQRLWLHCTVQLSRGGSSGDRRRTTRGKTGPHAELGAGACEACQGKITTVTVATVLEYDLLRVMFSHSCADNQYNMAVKKLVHDERDIGRDTEHSNYM